MSRIEKVKMAYVIYSNDRSYRYLDKFNPIFVSFFIKFLFSQ